MNRVYCLLVCLFCACQVSLCKELDEKVLFEELDQLLAQQQELTQEKERKIKIIKVSPWSRNMPSTIDSMMNTRLSSTILHTSMWIGTLSLPSSWTIRNCIPRVPSIWYIYFLWLDFLIMPALIDSIDVRELSGQDLQDYYQTYSDLVLFCTEFSVGTDFYSDNLSKILFYRKKLRECILDKNSLSAALIWQR